MTAIQLCVGSWLRLSPCQYKENGLCPSLWWGSGSLWEAPPVHPRNFALIPGPLVWMQSFSSQKKLSAATLDSVTGSLTTQYLFLKGYVKCLPKHHFFSFESNSSTLCLMVKIVSEWSVWPDCFALNSLHTMTCPKMLQSMLLIL